MAFWQNYLYEDFWHIFQAFQKVFLFMLCPKPCDWNLTRDKENYTENKSNVSLSLQCLLYYLQCLQNESDNGEEHDTWQQWFCFCRTLEKMTLDSGRNQSNHPVLSVSGNPSWPLFPGWLNFSCMVSCCKVINIILLLRVNTGIVGWWLM